MQQRYLRCPNLSPRNCKLQGAIAIPFKGANSNNSDTITVTHSIIAQMDTEIENVGYIFEVSRGNHLVTFHELFSIVTYSN